MSAKQTYGKPQVNRPTLPPEIWTLIFRHATLVSDLLSTDLDNYDKHDPAMRRQRKSFKQSLVTRRCLVLVCKAWYANAICFLYESLWLGRGKDVATLYEALRRSHNVSSDATLPLGWWTKRIDVAMRDSTDDPSRDVALVGDIIAMLPNLSIIILDVTGNRYSLLKSGTFPSSVLLSTSPENLKVVYCCHFDVVPQESGWFPFLNSRPHLRSISDFDSRTMTIMLMLQSIPHLPSLTSIQLSCPWTLDLLINSEVPNLQHLTYHIDDLCHEYPSPGPLFRRHGVKLRSLAMASPIPWMIDLISETCPNLVTFEFTVGDWTNLTTNMTTFPPVILIKIACRKLQNKSASYSHLFDFVVRAKVICPTLKTVRLSDERNVAGLKTHPRLLRDQLEVLRAAGVAFEDAEGRLLHPG